MQTALITGASKGIGKAMAKQLAMKGIHVVLVARSEMQLNILAQELINTYKISAWVLALDLTEVDAHLKLKQFCDSHRIKINILINNAGYGLSGAFDNYSLADNQNMMALNMNSLVAITQTFLPDLTQNSPSYILNIASTASYQAIPKLAIYAATKAFVLSFTRALYHELKPKNIFVTALSPGPTDTEFADRAQVGEKGQKAAQKVNMTPDDVAKIGLDAMFDKKPEVIAGLLNKIGAAGAWLMPKWVAEKIAGGIYD